MYFPQVAGNSLRLLVENPGQEGRSFLISELYPDTEDLEMQGCCYARGASNMWCFSKARPPKCTSTLKRIQEKPATWHSTGLEWGTRTAPRSAAPMVCASGRFLRQCWWHERRAADSAQELFILAGHDGWLISAVSSPDESRIATSGSDQTTQVHTTDINELLQYGINHAGSTRWVN